jgi:hypothetical protein
MAAGALADVPAGDDWVGLTRAFVHAGAADVIAALWSVDDRASALPMKRFYEHYELARPRSPSHMLSAGCCASQRPRIRSTGRRGAGRAGTLSSFADAGR